MIRLLPILYGLLVGLMLAPVGASGQSAACSHYASPTGSGQVCTAAQPCRVDRFWPLARPGMVLCLKDGHYRGADQMVLPPPGVRGTQAKPITVRAENDGGVLLDAQHQGSAVSFTSNTWMVVEGVNAKDGRESVFNIGGSHNIVRRSLGWNGTSGANPYVFYVWGPYSVAEDCAGWGKDIRKVMNGSQADNVQGAGFRRCWAEWNDHPQGESNPSNTFQLGYNTTNQLFENVIGTWDTRGQTSEAQAALHMFYSNDAEPNNVQGSKVLGSIFYAAAGTRYTPNALVVGSGLSGMRLVDVAAIAAPEHTGVMPFYFGNWPCAGSAYPCTGNVCQNCLAVHAGTPSANEPGSGWLTPGLKQGRGLEAATGGESAFTLLPGICKRSVNGDMTEQPLWPWPMDARIKAARVASGFPEVDVTAQIEALLGPIPAACKGGGTEPPIPPEPPVRPAGTPLACTGILGEGGAVAVACVPQEGRR